MIFTFKDNEFLSGTRYKTKTSYEGDSFRYAILENQRSTFGTITANLMENQGVMSIETQSDLNWQVNEFVVLQDKTRWIINTVTKMQQEINPQVLYSFNENEDTKWVLSLILVDNLENLNG